MTFGRQHCFSFFCAVFLVCSASGLWAQYSLCAVPDSADIRVQAADSWFRETLSSVRRKAPQVYHNDAGQIFRVSCEETSLSTAIVVAPLNNGAYPVTGRGSWVLYRDKKRGEATHIRLYISGDPDVYMQFYPSGNKTTADLYVYGAWTARGVPLGLPFDSLYTISIKQLFALTEKTVFRGYTSIDPRLYTGILQMTGEIRANLYRFVYTDDAAYDENGRPVYITDNSRRIDEDGKLGVNCSGFVKWITDALVRPSVGNCLKIDPLKSHTINAEGTRLEPWLESRDPNFGLDWTRNLAAAALSAEEGRTIRYPESGVDVRTEAFSGLTVTDGKSKKVENTVGYIKNTGYQLAFLKPLLFVLAVTEPDRFYLGSVRVNYNGGERVQNGVTSGTVIPQFVHTAAFFSYFDEKGNFQTAVFESGTETSLEEFIERYPGDFIHLVRIKASPRFSPL